MKRKDVMLIIVVGIFAAIISFIISGTFITTSEDRQQNVETAAPIETSFERPPAEYFNQDALNPTQTIQIGDDPNNQPFDTE
jgi:lipopolysaccharide export LptBFGC system permease protein LptF